MGGPPSQSPPADPPPSRPPSGNSDGNRGKGSPHFCHTPPPATGGGILLSGAGAAFSNTLLTCPSRIPKSPGRLPNSQEVWKAPSRIGGSFSNSRESWEAPSRIPKGPGRLLLEFPRGLGGSLHDFQRVLGSSFSNSKGPWESPSRIPKRSGRLSTRIPKRPGGLSSRIPESPGRLLLEFQRALGGSFSNSKEP